MVGQLIDQLAPSAPDFQLRDACAQLVSLLLSFMDGPGSADSLLPCQLSIMTDNPEIQEQLVSSHGMLAILEVLEGKCSRDVIMQLLQIINLVCQLHFLLCVVVSPLNSLLRPISVFWRVSV